ncbi:MAG: flagellar basal body P-ring formation chaperone FlgA [Pseudomonadota bacterium]
MRGFSRPPRVPLRAVLLALLAHALVFGAALLPAASEEAAVIRAARLLAPGTLLSQSDLVVPEGRGGSAPQLRSLIGMRLRHAAVAGAPLGPGDVAAPYVIERNSLVAMRFIAGGLVIRTEGRALGSAVLGGRVPVMNLASKETVTAVATGPGRVEIRR